MRNELNNKIFNISRLKTRVISLLLAFVFAITNTGSVGIASEETNVIEDEADVENLNEENTEDVAEDSIEEDIEESTEESTEDNIENVEENTGENTEDTTEIMDETSTETADTDVTEEITDADDGNTEDQTEETQENESNENTDNTDNTQQDNLEETTEEATEEAADNNSAENQETEEIELMEAELATLNGSNTSDEYPKYILYANGEELPAGDSDEWYEVSYTDSVTFTAEGIASETSDAESYGSDIIVQYADSIDGLASASTWSGIPGVGDYYLSFDAPDYDLVLDGTEYNYKIRITDSIDPVITDYSISGDDLHIAANDEGSGIQSYALSTSSEESSVSEWTDVESAPVTGTTGISITTSYKELEAGTYYLYVQDASGNIACSDVNITVTKLIINNYYENSILTDYTDYIAAANTDSPSVTLPATTRTKFNFDGYYTDGAYTGSAIDAESNVSLNAGSDNNYYAKWTLSNVSFENNLSSEYSKVYDGESVSLSVSLSEEYDSVSWAWYKSDTESGEYTAVDSASDNTLELTNVSDSGYYKAVATITQDGEASEAESDIALVSISKRALNLTIDNKEIVYHSDPPAYSMTAAAGDSDSGLAGTDTIESVFGENYSDNLICDYVNDGSANSAAGEYSITAGDGIQADNYELVITEGILTVTSLTVDDNVEVYVTIEGDSFTYTGSSIEPAVTEVRLTYISDAGNQDITLTTDDYDVSYDNNVSVGSSASVIITFKGNFSGSNSATTFEITKATYDVQTTINYSTWKYGETPSDISVGVDNTKGGTITYYYLAVGSEDSFDAADKSGAVTSMPVNAGQYYAYAVIEETANYNAITAAPVIFTIEKREIILTSATGSWTYDGNSHTSGDYTESGDGFVEGEGFHSVTVSGSVKTVSESPVTNDIAYVLTSATSADNYDITLNKGTLSITQAPLPTISSLKWSSTPGTIEWVAITRDGLNIQYEIQVYKDDTELGDPIVTSDTSLDIADIMIDDTVANGIGGYSATITAKIGTDSAGMYMNYTEGAASDMLAYKYTAKLTITVLGGDEGIESISFTDAVHGESEDDTVTYLLQGQKAYGNVTYNTGYENDDDGTCFNYTTGDTGLTKGSYTSGGYYTVTFTSSQLSSAVDASLVVKSLDSAPVCDNYSGSQADDYSYVQADISISDALGLYGYKLVNSDVSITEDNWTEIITDEDWTEIPYVSGRPQTVCTTSVNLSAEGVYYLAFKDTGDNIRYCSTPITVYEISFDANDSEATGTMSSIYKLKDSTVHIPANAFTKAGYVFTNWTAVSSTSTSILPDEASYVKNESAVFQAGWTNKKFSYTVNYYYQNFSLDSDGNVVTDTDGNIELSYELDSDMTTTYSCSYNSVISYDTAAIRQDRTGYEITDTPDITDEYTSSITVTEDGMTLNVYYNLLSYTMTYTYTDYDSTSKTIVDTFYYGQPFVEATKPSRTGYSFIGWNYGDAGKAPETMPDSNLNATGYYKADAATYTIRYYFQNIDYDSTSTDYPYLATSFGQDTNIQADEVISAEYGQEINAYITSDETSETKEIVTAREISGFTPVAVVVTYGDSEAKTFSSYTDLVSFANNTDYDSDTDHYVYSDIDGDVPDGVQDGPTYVSYYYTRNIYTLSMDVYLGNRDNDVHLYGSYYEEDNASWKFPYGYEFPEEGNDLSAAYFETYGYDSEGSVTCDNNKVHSVAWTKRWPTSGYATRDKYYLANFVDWSTGSRPVTMPAGDVKVVREYASREQSKYIVEVYIEKIQEVSHTFNNTEYTSYDAGLYEKATSFERYIEPGKEVSIVETSDGSETQIAISKLMEGIDCKDRYEHVDMEEEVLSATILENVYDPDDDTTILDSSITTLKLYMSRKSYDVTINYYRRDYDSSTQAYSQSKITSYTINQKWGTSYFIDSEYYYNGESESVPTGDNSENTKASTYIGNVTAAGDVANAYDFNTNGYSIANYWFYYSPSDSSGLGDIGSHSDYTKYTDDEPVSDDRFKKIRVGVDESGSKTYANVYYLQPVSDKHYYLKLVYKQYVDGVAVDGYSPLTTTIDDETYQVCVANKSDVFNGDVLRSGLEEVTLTYTNENDPDQTCNGLSGTFYRITDDTHSPRLLFTVVEDDRFYVGNLASYNYNSEVSAHIGRETFDSADNTPSSNYGTATKINHGSERIESEGIASPIAGVDGSETDVYDTHLAYYFKFVKDFTITYVYDGQSRKIDYGEITTVSSSDIGYDTDGLEVFDAGDGYDIVWYTDSNYEDVADEDIYVDKGKTLYGKRFNAPIENFDIAYYEMPDSAGYYTGSLSDLYAVTETDTVTYSYDENTTVNKTVNYIKYYNNETDMVLYASKKSHYATAFTEFSMPYSDYVTDGFEHDSKNTSNVLSGFCGTTSINLRSYYARTSALLTIRRNDSDTTSNDEVSTRVNGSAITVTNPSKTGYEFTGWKMYDYTGSTIGDELSADDYNLETGSTTTTFNMPICATLLEAQWTPAVIDFEIVHLFQDSSKKYQQELLESYRESPDDITDVVTRSDNNLTFYYIGSDNTDTSKLFAIVETFSETKSEDVINVSDHDLSSSANMVSFSNGTYQHNATDSKQLDTDTNNSFAAYYDAEVTFYYERDSSIVITTKSYSLDGGSDTGVTLSGAGSYYYGQSVNLYAIMQPTGYTFKGWYKVLSGSALTEDDITNLSTYVTNAEDEDDTNDSVITLASTDTDFALTASESEYYIAVTEPLSAVKPTITITISRDLDTNPLYYNYGSDSDNQFNASINWGEGVDSSANNIKAYKWYYYNPSEMTEDEYAALDPDDIDIADMTPIDNSNTSTFYLPSGYNAGYYILRCVADIERKDNGRTETAYGSYKFAVLPNEDYLTTTSVEDQSYTGDTYRYTEEWLYTPEDYTIYYSESDFTIGEDVSERLSLDDSDDNKVYTEMPGYRDVIVDDSHNPIPHVVYYYVESNDPNYESIKGSCSVELLPVPVTVTAVKAFTKIYDGTTEIQGKSDDAPGTVTYKYSEEDGTYSDYYRLQSGIEAEGETASPYYKINGILDTDSDKTMMLNFTASFDYMHAGGSGTDEGTLVTLSDMWVLSSDDTSVLHNVYENWNYVFPEGQTLQLSGQIKPYPLDIKWLPTSASSVDGTYETSDFVYNYTGSPIAPYIKIVGDTERIPDSADDFSVTVKNKQTNAGTYSAIPEVESVEGASYYPTDYTFTLENQTYQILSRYIKVYPSDVTKTYNATSQTMIDSEGEFRFETKESADGEYSDYTLPEGENISVTASKSYKDVGVYSDITAQNLSIYTLDTNGKKNVITDNYVIEYGSGTLTIEPCPVVISGINGVDKEYDGTTDADLDITDAVIALATDGTSSIYSGDTLTLEKAGYTESGYSGGYPGTFDTRYVANDKPVQITYTTDSSPLSLGRKGIALKAEGSYQNYVIDTDNSQSETTADIIKDGKVTVHIAAHNTQITYGTTIDASILKHSFNGFASGENDGVEAISTESGYPMFKLQKKDADGNLVDAYDSAFNIDSDLSFIADLDVGTYYVTFVEKTGTDYDGHHFVEGFTSEKYNVSWNYSSPATITIVKRKIGLSGVSTADEITKTYDKTTDVSDAGIEAITGTESAHGYYEFTTVDNVDDSGVITKDVEALVLSDFSASYNSENVAVTEESLTVGATAINVTDAVLSGSMADNYELVNTEFEVPAAITPRDITVNIVSQSVEYGSAVSGYEFVLDGNQVESDTDTIMSGLQNSCVIDCDYAAAADSELTDAQSNDAGLYAMNVSSDNRYTNPNYNITYPTSTGTVLEEYGVLTVTKKTLNYKASEVYISYGVHNPPSIYDGAFVAEDFVYDDNIKTLKNDNETAKIISDGSDGYIDVYTDSDCTVSAGTYEVGFTCDADENSLPGTYAVTPNNVASGEGGLYTQNYKIVAKDGTLTIKKFYILVEGVTVDSKVYDGTKVVSASQISFDNATFSYYEGATPKTGVSYADLVSEFGECFVASDIVATYSDPNVAEGINVSLTLKIEEGSALAARYELLTDSNKDEAETYDISNIFDDTSGDIKVSQTTATSDITPRNLTLKPADITINYADSISDDQIVVSGTGFADGEDLSNVDSYELNYTVTNEAASYIAGSDAGTYTIDISSSAPGTGIHGNYNISYETAILTVNQVSLPAPANITWNGGILSWDAVSGIGNVAVAGYKLEITKEGEDAAFKTVDCNTDTTYDFSEDIRAEGNGIYTVNICAVASDTNNSNYNNVKQYGEDATSEGKRAVLVTPVYSSDDVTTKATDNSKAANVYVDSNSLLDSYVVIAGETTSLNAIYTWDSLGTDGTTVYSSGYEVKSLSASVTGGITVNIVTDNSEGGSVIGSIAVSDEISFSTVNVILTLQKCEAEGELTINTDSDSAPYGATTHPEYSADVTHTDSNIDYEYTYEWYYVLGEYTYSSANTKLYDVVKTLDENNNVVTQNNTIIWDSQTFTFPRGKRAQSYDVYCNVTATRKDNGETVDLVNNRAFTITKPEAGDPNYLVLSVNSWDYGSSREPASCIALYGSEMGIVTIYYRESGAGDDAWSTSVPTEVGTYEACAKSAGTDSYPAVTSNTKEFTINKVTLDTPENFDMYADGHGTPYGLLKWDAVSGYVENAGTDPASEVTVSYEIVIAITPGQNGNYGPEEILGTEVTTDTQLNVLDYINSDGRYQFTIRALANDRTEDAGNNNCNDSGTAYKDTPIIGASIEAIEGNSKEYDGESIQVTTGYSDGNSEDDYQFKWYKNGTEIEGATSRSIYLTDVDDSGYYSVSVLSPSTTPEWVSSKTINITISKRPISINGFSDSKTYDATELTHAGIYTGSNLDGVYTMSYAGTADSSGTALVDGATLDSLTYNGTITNAGTQNNMPSDAVISNSDGDKTSNYDITYVPGTLTINQRAASITAPSDSKVYDGTALTAPGIGDGVAAGKKVVVEGLISGHTLTSVSMTEDSTITDAGEQSNSVDISSITIEDADNTDVSANYEFTKTDGLLTVTKAPSYITVSDAEYVYDGTDKTITAQIAGTTESEEFKSAVLKYSLVTTDADSNEVYGDESTGISYKNAGEYRIRVTLAESDNHQAADPVYATLTITKRSLTIQAVTKSKEYDSMPHTLLDTEYIITGDTSLGSGDSVSHVDVYNDGAVTNYGQTENSHVRDAVIVDSQSADVTDSYDITYLDGELSFTRRPITITARDHTKEYDGTALSIDVPQNLKDIDDDNNEYYIVSGNGLAGNDTMAGLDISGSLTIAGSINSMPSGAVITNGSSDVTDNYDISYNGGTIEVTKRPITITAINKSREFDGAEWSFAESYAMEDNMYEIGGDGLADGDTVTSVTITGSQTQVGNSVLIPSEAVIKKGNANRTSCYDITYNNGSIEITSATLVVRAADVSKVYDGEALTYENSDFETKESKITVTGLGQGDSVTSVKLTGSQTNVGKSDLVPSDIRVMRNGDDVTGSYNIRYEKGSLEVTKRPLTVQVGNATNVYGNAFNADAVSYSIIDGSEVVEGEARIRVTTTSNYNSDVGNYDITAVADNSNYEVTSVNGTYTITKRHITISAADGTVRYTPGVKEKENGYTVTEGTFVVGDLIDSVTVTGSQETVGSSSNRASGAVIKNGDRDVTDNYEIEYVDGTLTVEKGQQEINAKDLVIVYDGKSHTVEEISRSLKYDDGSEIHITSDKEEITTPDEMTVTLTVDSNDCYEGATKTVTVRVVRRPITITADSASKEYDGTGLSKNSYTITSGSLVEGDEISLESLAIRADNNEGSISEVGTVTNKITGNAVIMHGDTDVSAYYNITYKNGQLTISPKPSEESSDETTGDNNEKSSGDDNNKKSSGDDNNKNEVKDNTKEKIEDNKKDNKSSDTGNNTESNEPSQNVNDNNDTVSNDSNSWEHRQDVPVNGSGDSTQNVPETSNQNGSVRENSGNESTERTGTSVVIQDTDTNQQKSEKINDSTSVISNGSEGTTIDYSKYIVGTKTNSSTDSSSTSKTGTTVSSGTSVTSSDAGVVDCEVVSADINNMINSLLSKDEQKEVSSGSNLRFRVEVKKDDDALTDAVRKSVTKASSDSYTIVGTFDSSFFVKIGDAEESLIEQDYSSVTVSFRIPDEMWDDSMIGHAKIYRTYVDENGELVTELVVSDITDQNLVMDTDNYSTYTLVMDESVVEDDYCYIHWLILLIMLLIIIKILLYYRRRRKDEKSKTTCETEEERKQYKERKKRHLLILLLLNILSAILLLFGNCHWDLIAEIATLLSTILVESISNHRLKKYIEHLTEYKAH